MSTATNVEGSSEWGLGCNVGSTSRGVGFVDVNDDEFEQGFYRAWRLHDLQSCK